MTTLRTYSPHALLILGLALFAAAPVALFHSRDVRAAGSSQCSSSSFVPLAGYAWAGFCVYGNSSDTAATDPSCNKSGDYQSGPGWISFSYTNAPAGTAAYGVCEDPSTGNLSGYAWSNRYGWISFNAPDSGNLPTGCSSPSACAPKVDLPAPAGTGTLAVTGWATACAAYANANSCSGSLSSNTGGWGGWISLSDTSGKNYYSIKQGANYGPWIGDAWGGSTGSGPGALGWIDMGGHGGTVAPQFSPISVSCLVLPSSGDADTPFTWTATASGGSGSYTTYTWGGDTSSGPTATNKITTQYSNVSAGTKKNVSVTVTDSKGNSSPTVYCTTTYTGPNGPTASGPGTGVMVYPKPTLSADPTTVVSGQSTKLTWDSNGNTCKVTGDNGFSSTLSSATNEPSGPIPYPTNGTNISNFYITCTDPSGDPLTPVKAPVTVIQPNITIGANPTRVASNSSSKIFWTSTNTNTCDVTGTNGFSQIHTGTNDNTSSPNNGDPTQGYDSGPIKGQTIFTATCQTKGSPVSNKVIVNILPVFQQF